MAPSALVATPAMVPPAVGTSASALMFRADNAQQRAMGRLQRRQFGSSISSWPDADKQRLLQVSDAEGNFNGTCTSPTGSLPPSTDEGECTSYYPDITVYCCAGAGGRLADIAMQTAVSATTHNMSAVTETITETTCETSNYNMMLVCYKNIAQSNCRSASSGPWGVCHPSSSEWNQSASLQDGSSDGVSSINAAGGHSSRSAQPSTLSLAVLLSFGLSLLLTSTAMPGV